MPLTKRQREILNYLGSYSEQHGYAPSFEEIAEQFGYSSLATVHEHLSNLERKGYIKRAYNESRAIEILPNEVLGRVMHDNLVAVGGVMYTPEEHAFALKIGQTVFGKPPAPETAALIAPFVPNPPREAGGSTDVGDVSWTVPTVGLRAAAFAPGTPGHSWQAVPPLIGDTVPGVHGLHTAAPLAAEIQPLPHS